MKTERMSAHFGANETWSDAFCRVRNRIALVAAAICAAAAPLSSQAVSALGSISDVRVGPLLTTTWSQTGAGGTSGPSCYNYYTPNHYACGCVATAIAQIMYFHKYPTERINPGETIYASVNQAELGASNAGSWSVGSDGTGSYTLYSGGASTAFNPAYGGPYDWSSMVASPTSDTSENSRKAIGLLTRDVGLAVFADYNVKSGETSGFTRARASSLILNLHYADAVRTGFDANKLIANLDAGLPVLLALTSHEVVADGYGYHNGTLYIHINYGHGGTNSGWYDPTSTIGTSNMSIADMVANIFPPTRGARHSSVISGRVLDANGSPVANATVTATGATTATTNSNANGTYAFILPAGTYTFTATSGNSSGTLSNCAVEASEQKTRAEFADPYNQGGWDSGVNNSRSGVNVTLGKTATMGEPDAYLQYVESNGSQTIDTRVTPGPTESVTPFVTAMAVYADLDWTNGICMVSSGYNDFHPLKNNDGKIGASFKNTGGSVMSLASGTALNSGRRHVATTVVKNQPFTVNVDGAIATSGGNAGTLGSGRTLYAFASNNGSSAGDNRCMTKLYGLKICINDELVRDYVPAIKDGVAGLYDRQNDEWYHSQSGAELIAGPALSEYPSLPNPVTADYTLMSDVTIDGTLTVNSGSTIYLNGYKLTVKGLDGSGTITDVVPAAAHPGELHVVVPSGTTVANSTVAFTGTMKLVVEGSGTFTASKANQTYTGGTEVQAGTLTLGTATHPLGNGNATQTVTLRENAVFNFANCKNDTTCCYNFNLYGGSEVRASSSRTRWIRLVGSATLYGDATFKGGTFDFFGGIQSAHTTLTLNGHTLYLNLNTNDGNLRFIKTLDAGSVVFSAGAASFYGSVDFSTATLGFEGSGWFFNGNSGLTASNLYFRSTSNKKWRSQGANESYVLGTYIAGDWRAPFTMRSGATLDLSEVSGTWNAGGLPIDGNNADRNQAGRVTFLSANATYTVNVGARNIARGEKIVQFVDGYSPASTVEFNLVGVGVDIYSLAVVSEGGHTYLEVTGQVPYARWVIDSATPANSGWRFYNPNNEEEVPGWTGGVTSEMEVRIYSYAEHQAVKLQNVSPFRYSLYGPFQIPSDATEWDLTSCFDILAGDATIDVNGKKLYLNKLDFAGTITDTSADTEHPGEVYVTVASGTANNTAVALTGNLKLVKDGSGTLTASKASQTYTGGTEVLAGTLALGTATHPLGDGNATQTVTVGGNGILNLATYKSESTCYYNLVLESGAEVQAGDVVDRNTGRIASITLNGNATVKMAQRTLFGGSAAGKACQLTFNGYTLTLLSLGDGNFGHVHVNDYGTFRLDANSSSTDCPGMYRCEFDLRGAKLEVTERAFLKFGNWAFYATDFVYGGLNKFTGGAVKAVNSVYGRYVAGSNRPPFTMQSGSTLDLSGQSDTWNAGGQTVPATHSAVSGTGRVTFLAANATYTVDIGTRSVALGEKLVQFADDYDPAASVVFNLAATGAAQTPAERDLGLAVASEGGHTYLVVKSLSTPYARWVIDGANPANSGWKFYNIRTGAEDTSWTRGVTSDMEVRIYSYAEHAAVVQQGVSPMSYTLYGTFQIPSDVAAWDLTSCFDSMADGASIDVNGKKLYLNKVNFTGTITDTTNDTDHPGEVHVTVASGTAENTAVALTGNLKLVKKGAGTLTASKANQSYVGGTDVQAGTLALGTATHPLGNGNATQTVTVGENAVFNFNAKCSDSTCSYGFILNTNSVLRMGTVGSRWNRQVFAITLLGDATYDFGTARTLALFGGGNAGETVITLNGHTLTIEAPADGDINTCNIRTVGEGTISYRSGMAGGFYPEGGANRPADFSSANVEVVGNAWMNLGSLAFIAKDFKYTSSTHKWTGQLGANPPRVTGRYVAGAYRPPFTMTSGSTLDLTEVTGTWDNKTNVQDLTTSYADQTTKIGKVSFTGAINVDLSGRTDLRTIAKSETPYVVTWDSQPNATFTLDAATKKNFKIEPDGTGIKIIPCDGLKVFIK